jgi:hypothetical protein
VTHGGRSSRPESCHVEDAAPAGLRLAPFRRVENARLRCVPVVLRIIDEIYGVIDRRYAQRIEFPAG